MKRANRFMLAWRRMLTLSACRLALAKICENAYLLGAVCQWLNKVAGDRPLVISCSFSSHNGGHDGYLVKKRNLMPDSRFQSKAAPFA